MAGPDAIALVRHGETAYNVAGKLNGDPAVALPLDPSGVGQVTALKPRIDALDVDLAVHTRFPRTVQTLGILLAGRDGIPRRECPLLDDVLLGEFEGRSREAYRAWRAVNGPDARPAGGESRRDALRRYTEGFRRIADSPARFPLVVTHDIPIRFLSNAAQGADPLDGPVTSIANASLAVFDGPVLQDAITRMEAALTAAAG
ncbi:MAG: histidine phosphatase family protein [Thermoleophilia bacterium]